MEEVTEVVGNAEVGPTVEEEFMRKLQVFHEVLELLGQVWIEGHRNTNKGGASNPFIRVRLVSQETKRVSEMTPEDASSTFAATPLLESLEVMLSRCMTGKRALAVKSTSPVTENHNKNGYVNYKNFIMTNVDNNHDTKYTNKNDTNNHNAHDLHK